MSITSLDGKRFAGMVQAGASHLTAHADMVDALNVFPVPDGDTGTNMNLSMTSGAKEVQQHMSDHFGQTAAALSKGLLMGARGNSGVILSQLFRGFSKAVENKQEVTGKELAQAFEAGVETAYKAVMKPVEGTILTVAKDAAKKAASVSKKQTDIIGVMESLVEEARSSLARTPDHLPVLKEVGVVDSGGQGLLLVYEGFLAELKGEKLSEIAGIIPNMDELVSAQHHKNIQSFMDTADIEFGYCTEFMVRFEEGKVKNNPFSEEKFRSDLSQYGDSLLVISDDEIAKVHIHSEQPGEVLTYGQRYGSLISMKIENMRQQHSDIVGSPGGTPVSTAVKKEKQEFGVVTVCMGEGVARLFESIGASVVIEGGQTMNPSTEDIVKAIEEVNAKKVIILPNNKNIIMAAEQAAQVVEVEAAVVPSKTIPQGMTSLLAYNPEASLEENKSAMTAALSHVKTGQITFAVRDTNIDGIEIAKDDFMGIADGKILLTDKNKTQAAKELLQAMIDEDSEIVTIIYGEDASAEEVKAVSGFIEEQFAEVEVEIHNGKQPLYSFIFAVE
ncbi:DAK2 domain-containing protein [Bacillus aerolatus]|uniref:DAK2 domain-containing protein n=1 Tax=Bacillus aerolatus TaxID=2653354 RepID=A0A6I1FNI7_9BACI|nr:DAK2 domain-containing protein [Bacillus aerolatus]KAB7708014.1 DAK2 domain-containing protein [Bacillus aerolatus]